MARQHRRYKGWVVRWEWAGDHAAVDQPIIALFPPQTGSETVRRFVEWHYAATQYEPSEMLEWVMLRPKENPYPARFIETEWVLEDGTKQMVPWQGAIVCGHNPYIVARIASNVHLVRRSDYLPGELVWEDLPPPTRELRRPPDG